MDKEEKGSWIMSIIMVLGLIVMIAIGIVRFNSELLESMDDYCIEKGYNESTDSGVFERQIVIECDYVTKYYYVRECKDCVKFDKWGNCDERKRSFCFGEEGIDGWVYVTGKKEEEIMAKIENLNIAEENNEG